MRTVLTVLLAVALLAASLPGINRARVERSDAEIRDELDRLIAEARGLYAGNDGVPPGTDSARRTVSLRLPTRGFDSAGTDRVRIAAPQLGSNPQAGRSSGGGPAGNAAFVWRVQGGTKHATRADGVPLRRPTGEPLTFTSGGSRTVVLSLVSAAGERAVVVEAASG